MPTRRTLLHDSAAKWLNPAEKLQAVAMLSKFKPAVILSSTVAGSALILISTKLPPMNSWLVPLLLIDVVIALRFGTKAVVLAFTDKGLLLLEGSPIRNVATGFGRRLSQGSTPQRVSGNLITTSWRIDGELFHSTRYNDATIASIEALCSKLKS